MDLDTFWRQVDLLAGSTSRETMLRLEGALGALPAAEVESFGEILARLLYDLDTKAHFRQEVSAFNEGDIEPEEMSPDMFRDLRCAVVIAGRAAYDAVRADPAALGQRLWPEVFDAVRLIDVLDAVYEKSGLATGYAPTLDIETGSNPAGPTAAEVEAAGLDEARPWMQLDVGMEDPDFFRLFQAGDEQWRRFDRSLEVTSTELLENKGLRADLLRCGIAAVDVEFNLLPRESPAGLRVRRRGSRLEIDLQTHFEQIGPDQVEAWARTSLQDAMIRARSKLAAQA